jgi:branched-chain amino acid transport system substrate-binding protein
MERNAGFCVMIVLLLSVLMVGMNGSAMAAEELKIGFLGPLSGPATFAGKCMQNAAILAVEDANAAGGVTIGGKKYQIKLIEYDTKYSLTVAKSSAEKLIFEDKVKFIIGGVSTDSQGFQAVTEQNKVMIFPGGGVILVSPKTPYTFRATTLSDLKCEGIYEFIKKKMPDKTRVAIINPDNPVGEYYIKMSQKATKNFGFEIVASERVSTGSSDFTPVLTKMLVTKPDIIDLGGTGGGSDSALIIKQARELGYKGLMVCAVGLQSKAVLQVAGAEAMEGVIEEGFTPDDPALPESFRKLADRCIKRFPGVPFIALTAETYDTCVGLFRFLNGQEKIDTTVLKDSFSNYSWKGIYGESRFGGLKTFGIKNHIQHAAFISQWKSGKPVILETIPGILP